MKRSRTHHQPDGRFGHPIEGNQEEENDENAYKGEQSVIENASENKRDKNSNGEEQLEECT